MQVEIVNWEKFNPRKDLKSSSWLRFENNFCTHPDFFDLSNDQKMVWIFMLCEASRKQSATITVNTNMVAALLKVDTCLITETIQSFEIKGLVTLRARNTHVTRATRGRNALSTGRVAHVSRCRPTDETNGRDERTNENSPPPTLSGGTVGPTDSDFSLADRWIEHALSVMPKIKHDRQKWADAIRLLRTSDGLSDAEVVQVFEFVKDDPFWRTNAISPIAIRGRSKSNGLKKIENIRMRMEETGGVGKGHWTDYLSPEEKAQYGAT